MPLRNAFQPSAFRPLTFRPLIVGLLALLWFLAPRAPSQEAPKGAPESPDLARVKEEEAREKLERLEEAMDRLSRILAETEPQNAAKLKLAFRESRERLLREGMDRIVKYLKERKLDRALEEQGQVKINLEEILSILLEKDIDPRELLRHIRRIRDLLTGLDKVIKDETSEKMASDDAHQAGASSEALSRDLEKLEDLIRREKALEKGAKDAKDAKDAQGAKDPKDPAAAAAKALGKLASEQDKVRDETSKLRAADAERGAEERRAATPGREGEAGEEVQPGGEPPIPAPPGLPPPGLPPKPGQPPRPGQDPRPEQRPEPGQPGAPGGNPPGSSPDSPDKSGDSPTSNPDSPTSNPDSPTNNPGSRTEPPPAKPEQVLDKKALERAEEAMAAASEAMRKGDQPRSSSKATEARAALEESVGSAREKLERLRAQRNFKELKSDQDATRKETDSLAAKMKEPPPLVSSPEAGVPGQSDVQAASQDMQDASKSLGQGSAGKASRSQAQSLDKLKTGREKSEEALEELQRALRDRLLAYLREKFTKMLNDQRSITRETRSLDLKLRALRAVASAGAAGAGGAGSTPGTAGTAGTPGATGAAGAAGPAGPVGRTGAAEAPAALEPEIDRKDRQLAENLASRESETAVIATDVIDLLAEDGTTLVFPGVVEEVKADLLNASGLLSRIQTGERTQHIQTEIETALEDILRALEQAQRSPPPPNPSQGRSSKSGAGPLLPLSSELKMVRALQARVNERTRAFDLSRKPSAELSPEEKLQVNAIAKKQKEVEEMLRKLREAVGEE